MAIHANGNGSGQKAPGIPPLASKLVVILRRDVPLAVLDLSVVLAAYLGPLALRFDGIVPSVYWRNFWLLVPVFALIHLTCNYVLGLYGQMWRYASVQEARRIVVAGAAAGAAVLSIVFLYGGSGRPLPLSVLILGAGLALMGFGAIRFQSRLFAFRRRVVLQDRRRILLVGAGEAGSMVLRDIRRSPALGLDVVGVLDDNPRKMRASLHGVAVLGTRAAIPPLVRDLDVDEVLLAIPSATGEVVRDVAALCEEVEVPLRVLPSVREVVGGRVTARDIRDLGIEDLLGRKQVETDLEAVSELIRGRRVMVTGAGGSIGSEIARQVAELEPSALILLDHDETHLHDVVLTLRPESEPQTALADVRDRDLMLDVFGRTRPDVVFHAAAHKHVPLLELHPAEALRTNVLGTANVADASVATGVQRFVLISTDKAIAPTSVMGSSKWVGEQVVRSLRGTGCVFCAVRFGNVLGSRGSVIPTFLGQIRRGGPLTVTDPSMARYFMSVQEAVQLVLQAAVFSDGGEVFTLDMGEPVNILDLAKKLIRLSGRVPDRDLEIAIVGPRPGEKLVEDIVDHSEELLPSGHPSINVARLPAPDPAALRGALRELELLAAEGQHGELGERIKALANGALLVTTGEAQ